MWLGCFSFITSADTIQIKVSVFVGIEQKQAFIFRFFVHSFGNCGSCKCTVAFLGKEICIVQGRSSCNEIFPSVTVDIANGKAWSGLRKFMGQRSLPVKVYFIPFRVFVLNSERRGDFSQ